jgi:hypothetical protein
MDFGKDSLLDEIARLQQLADTRLRALHDARRQALDEAERLCEGYARGQRLMRSEDARQRAAAALHCAQLIVNLKREE